MNKVERLREIIKAAPPLAVAVSGGVDSVTLALFIAHTRPDCSMFHALSPAVPSRATDRVRSFADTNNWDLTEIVAGEFDDDNYLANPYNRCFYCKMNLYAEIRKKTELLIVSGANVDDLTDYRPGLTAAKNYNVRHPYVEAGFEKPDVRSLARQIGTAELADLPASPCLSSRIETGIRIDSGVLASVNRIEEWLSAKFHTQTVRCRVRPHTITIEVDESCLRSLSPADKKFIWDRIFKEFLLHRSEITVDFSAYRMGSAFVAAAVKT
jgi:uncharacterized protein